MDESFPLLNVSLFSASFLSLIDTMVAWWKGDYFRGNYVLVKLCGGSFRAC